MSLIGMLKKSLVKTLRTRSDLYAVVILILLTAFRERARRGSYIVSAPLDLESVIVSHREDDNAPMTDTGAVIVSLSGLI